MNYVGKIWLRTKVTNPYYPSGLHCRDKSVCLHTFFAHDDPERIKNEFKTWLDRNMSLFTEDALHRDQAIKFEIVAKEQLYPDDMLKYEPA